MVLIVFIYDKGLCIRYPDRIPETARDFSDQQQHLKTAVFALGSFWRSEAVFGCSPGVVRTTVGYAGGSKTKPEYRNVKYYRLPLVMPAFLGSYNYVAAGSGGDDLDKMAEPLPKCSSSTNSSA